MIVIKEKLFDKGKSYFKAMLHTYEIKRWKVDRSVSCI